MPFFVKSLFAYLLIPDGSWWSGPNYWSFGILFQSICIENSYKTIDKLYRRLKCKWHIWAKMNIFPRELHTAHKMYKSIITNKKIHLSSWLDKIDFRDWFCFYLIAKTNATAFGSSIWTVGRLRSIVNIGK